MEVINGVCLCAMRRTALGLAPPQHDVACASLVLRALGMAPEEASAVARRPLPPLQLLREDAAPPAAAASARRGRARSARP